MSPLSVDTVDVLENEFMAEYSPSVFLFNFGFSILVTQEMGGGLWVVMVVGCFFFS